MYLTGIEDRMQKLCLAFEIFVFFGGHKGMSSSRSTLPPKKSKISNVRQDFCIRSSIPVRYILVLPENAQNNRIALYSSKYSGGTSQNTLKVAERLTFTLRASNINPKIIFLEKCNRTWVVSTPHEVHSTLS